MAMTNVRSLATKRIFLIRSNDNSPQSAVENKPMNIKLGTVPPVFTDSNPYLSCCRLMGEYHRVGGSILLDLLSVWSAHLQKVSKICGI